MQDNLIAIDFIDQSVRKGSLLFFIGPVINLKATNSYDSSVEIDVNEEADLTVKKMPI